MPRSFTLDYWIDDGWYVGKLREVPNVFSQGESLDELKSNIQDAYQLMMAEAPTLPVSEFRSTAPYRPSFTRAARLGSP